MRNNFVGLGYRWPTWCYLPAAMVGTGLGKEIALDVNTNVLSPATVMATLAAACAGA